MQVTVRGQAIDLQFTNRLSKDCDGNCDEPKTQPRKIRVRKSLTGKRKLEVILHEFCTQAIGIWTKRRLTQQRETLQASCGS